MSDNPTPPFATTEAGTSSTAPAVPDVVVEPPRSFSQAELDRIVQDRLARQKAQYQDYDELKGKAAKFDEVDAANKTELQRVQERADALEKTAAQAVQARGDALLRAAIVSEAARRNVVDPDAVIAMLDRSLLEFDDDGSPTNIATAVDSLLEEKSYLLAGQRAATGSADQGARTGVKQATREEIALMTDEQYRQAKSDGRLTSFGLGTK